MLQTVLNLPFKDVDLFNLQLTVGVWYYFYPHFTDEETETQERISSCVARNHTPWSCHPVNAH